MMPSNRFSEITTSAPTPPLAISSTASYTVWAGSIEHTLVPFRRKTAPIVPVILIIWSSSNREWLALRCGAGRAAQLIFHFHETSAPFVCTWNEIFRFALLLPGISESAYHRVDNFCKVVIFHPNSVFVSPSMEQDLLVVG